MTNEKELTTSSDPYAYPGTDVLRNKGNKQDAEALKRWESDIVGIRLATVASHRFAGEFNQQRLQDTHRYLFGDVYDWAGKTRAHTGTMTKDRNAGYHVTYGDSAHVETQLGIIFAQLKNDNYLQGLDQSKFCEKLAYYYGELDAIHPFREGNSRTLRQFSTHLAQSAGYDLDWAKVSATEEQREALFLARDTAVLKGNSAQLADIIGNATTKSQEQSREAERRPQTQDFFVAL